MSSNFDLPVLTPPLLLRPQYVYFVRFTVILVCFVEQDILLIFICFFCATNVKQLVFKRAIAQPCPTQFYECSIASMDRPFSLLYGSYT